MRVCLCSINIFANNNKCLNFLAHHARKNNPYNQILQDFYLKCSPQSRPKVFGMTASPVWNHKNPYESLRVLECNMQAKIIGVQENDEELAEYSPRPTEVRLSILCAE
jgi:endoribonuclease Dicer